MSEIVPNQLFVADYSYNNFILQTLSSELEAQNAISALDLELINWQKLKVDIVYNCKERLNGPQEKDKCFKCGRDGHWGLDNVLIEHHQQEDELFQFKIKKVFTISLFLNTEAQGDLLQDLVHILLIHLHSNSRRRRDAKKRSKYSEGSRSQRRDNKRKKVLAAEDHKEFQGPDLQLAINNVSHACHLRLDERRQN